MTHSALGLLEEAQILLEKAQDCTDRGTRAVAKYEQAEKDGDKLAAMQFAMQVRTFRTYQKKYLRRFYRAMRKFDRAQRREERASSK